MSLLGRLLSGAKPASPANALDSNLDDQFTYNLLFPEPEALCHNDQIFPLSSGTALAPATTNPFDVSLDIELDIRDIRVIIMQEATSLSGSAYLLYDSHSPPPQSAAPPADRQPSNVGPMPLSRTEGRRSISSPRKGSIGQNTRAVVIQQDNAPQRATGAFGRSQQNRPMSYIETDTDRSVRVYKEEVNTLANLIFGNSELMAYKGPGTKVHVLSSEPKAAFTSSSYAGDTHGSFGRSSTRSSKLAQSYTSDTVHGPGYPNPSMTRTTERKRVLITRMFPVPLPNDDRENALNTPTSSIQSKEPAGYPFPNVNDSNSEPLKTEKPQPKQKKTPMYAVGLLIHLPTASQVASFPNSRASFRGPSSYKDQDSCPSSFNSARNSGWTMLGHGFGVDSMDSSYSSEVDDKLDHVIQHWDVIMRTLSHLQAVATSSLLPMLKQADVASPDIRREPLHVRAPSASISISGKRVAEDLKPPKIHKVNLKLVHLAPNCLMQCQTIHKEIDASRRRILSGMKSNQVVTGQGRWGIWREEARTVCKWAGTKDEGFFFFNLLTAFLGNHTEWLQALGPSWYRRRHYQHQRASKDDDVSLPARTIIVSDNKLMARRLVFLLSAFLPSNHQASFCRPHRPSTSISFGGFSQSPPQFMGSIPREESLRRKMNKRASRVSHSRTMSFPAQRGQQEAYGAPDIHHDRRPSDASHMRTANLPIPGRDIGTRKSSAVTTSTVTPITTAPHFSTRRPVRGTGPVPRPGSSGSLAADDLIRSLKRGDSSNVSMDSQGYNSRWGSMLSGFWNNTRRGSTASTSVEPLSIDGLEICDPHHKPHSSHRRGKLTEMVDEATSDSRQRTKNQEERELRKSDSGSTSTAKGDESTAEDVRAQVIHAATRVKHPSGAYDSPVKTSINEDDGVIDIDVPLPDYLAFETAVSSPSSSGYLSTPGFGNGMEGFEHYSRAGPDTDTTINVGGWLQHYNPDFTLQAIPSPADISSITEEVKASMRAEPTPIITSTLHPNNTTGDRWIDISSAIIADTTNFTIKHILYRRLVSVKCQEPTTSNSSRPLDSRYGNVYSAAQLTPGVEIYGGHVEDCFIEDHIIAMDETLIEAVERITAQSGQASKNSSPSSSRPASSKGGRREQSNSESRSRGFPEHNLEVPRNECKKTVLRALEEIARQVAESRKESGEAEDEIERESFLREGVRNWLASVETMD